MTGNSAEAGPTTMYARSGQVHIAYQILGSGPPDLVLVPGFVSHVEAAWDWPYLARFLHRLASFGRLVVFDKRGTGLSDPMKHPPTLPERVDDIRAVMDAGGLDRAHLLGVSEGGALSIAFAAKYPQRVESLILYGSYSRKVATTDYPWGVSDHTVSRFLDRFDEAWASGAWWDIVNPDLRPDLDTQRWWARYLRVGASPSMARDLMLMNAWIDVRDLLPDIRSPALVLHRADDRWVEVGNGRYLADHIAGAKFVELPGADHRPWVEDADAVLDQVQAAVCGALRRPRHTGSSLGVQALSRREHEIVLLAVTGQSTPDIARHLTLSERTIETHLRNAYTKLDVNSRLELIRRASQLGIDRP
jgi:pimeloyl-ACP methyl ester carboxylesterase/DNA-binding CsgD family transcriptional regulator